MVAVHSGGKASPALAVVQAVERRLCELWWGTYGASVGSGGGGKHQRVGSTRRWRRCAIFGGGGEKDVAEVPARG